jgi:hypothetical protein
MSANTLPAVPPIAGMNLGSFSARAQSLGGAVTVLYCTIIAIIALGFPLANWDMIPYTALAQSVPGQDMAEIHQKAYDTVRLAVSPGDFMQLTEDRRYRVAQYASYEAFATMLPMYEVKWLYVEAVRALSGMAGVIEAQRLLNAVSMVAIGIVITLWLNAGRALVLAPLVIGGLAMCDIGTIARITTPDMLAGALVIAGVFALHSKQALIAAALLALATLARPDHILLAAMLAAMLLVTARDWRNAVLIGAASLAAFAFASNVDSYPGWWTHVYLTQIEYVPTLEGFSPEFSLATYMVAIIKASARALAEEAWPVMLALGMLSTVWLAMKQDNVSRPDLWLAATLMAAVIVKFFIFPINEARFQFAYLVPAMMVLVIAWVAAREAAPENGRDALPAQGRA